MTDHKTNPPVTFTIERHGGDGWFFISCAEVPGLFLFGPKLDDLLERVPSAIALLESANLEAQISRVMEALTEQAMRAQVQERGWSKVQAPVTIPQKIANLAPA